MKRDLDLVRNILFKLEETEDDYSFSASDPHLQIDGCPRKRLSHHLEIMAQAGLLHAETHELAGGFAAHAVTYYSVSWQGHEFLSALRDETRWKEVKKIMVRAGGFVTEVALDIAKDMVK